MTRWRGVQLQKQVDWIPAMFARRLMAPTGRDSVLQWVIVSMVGLGLGIYTIAVSTFPTRWALLFVLVMLCPFIMIIFGNVRRLLLAIIILEIPFQLDVQFGTRPDAAELGALDGLNISVTTLALAALYALWLAELLVRADVLSRPLFRLSLPLALYLAVATLSGIVAHDIDLAFFGIFLLGQTFMLYLYIINTVRTRQDVLFIVTILLIGLALESIAMIALRFIGHSITIGNIVSLVIMDSRVGGTLGHPNAAGSYLSWLLAPAAGILLTRSGSSYKWLAALGFSLGVAALALTLSRGSWTAFILSITILCLLAWHRGWLPATIPLVAVLFTVLLFFIPPEAILTRISGDDGGSAQGRFPLMRLAFQMIKDNPVLGVGTNNFAIMIKQYATPEFAREWLYTVHNQYLLVWAENGIGGLVAYIWFLLVTLQRGWQGWMLRDRFLSPLTLGLAAAVVGHMFHMNVDLFNHRPQIQMLWLVAGLITAISIMDVNTERATGCNVEGHKSLSAQV